MGEDPMRIERIVSGGQTGADRAALDWAIAHGVPHGGWCPAGRVAEDGVIPEIYQLTELPHGGYRQRTRANVRDSDATLIVSIAPVLSGGSLLTKRFAESFGKPVLHVHPGECWQRALADWLAATNVRVLNVAGPRASGEPTVADFARRALDELWHVRGAGD